MPERRARGTSPRGLVLTWAALVVLTALGVVASRAGNEHGGAAVLFALAVLKVALIALVFMELRKAHPAWALTVGVGVLGVVIVSAIATLHAW